MALPINLLAQKTISVTYPGPSTVDLYKNAQVITYQDRGVLKSDTLYTKNGDTRLSFPDGSKVTDHGNQMLFKKQP
jgi:hypothetical protein